MINWKEQSEGDYIAIEGDYMLRVEDMGDWYWWNVSYKDNDVKFGNALQITNAKLFAEKAMNKHFKLK